MEVGSLEVWRVGLFFGALPRTPARGNAPCTQASPKGDAFFCPCALAPQKEHSTETHTFAHGSAMQHFCRAPLFDPYQKGVRRGKPSLQASCPSALHKGCAWLARRPRRAECGVGGGKRGGPPAQAHTHTCGAGDGTKPNLHTQTSRPLLAAHATQAL